ncbi:MAG: carbonic anhydrase [Bryobacterales bacterium]|nr:carbonic anhydrase [Bryobacterales bacterium]
MSTRREIMMGAFLTPFARPQVRPAGPSHAPAMKTARQAATIRNAEDVLLELKAGNKRFCAGRARHPHTTAARIRETARGQHPFAVVLCCADSRVPPEIFLDLGIGDIFTVRVAGNVANTDEIASVEYAVEHLSTALCVVVGHTRCGAVTAVVNGDKVSAEIAHLVQHIGEAAEKTRKHNPALKGSDLIEESVRVNVFESMEDLIRGSETIAGKVRQGALKVVGAVYNVETGAVDWMGSYPGALPILR